VAVDGGAVVAVTADHAARSIEPVAALFELLRFEDGSFAFDADAPVDSAGSGAGEDVDTLLEGAGVILAEWREIESVVPSLDAWVVLAPDLPGPDITVDAATWRLVATIGSGLTVADLAAALELPEVPVCRIVRDLVVLGLGVVTDAPAAPAWEPAAAAEDPGRGPLLAESYDAPPLTDAYDSAGASGYDPIAPGYDRANGFADGDRDASASGYGSGSAEGYGSSESLGAAGDGSIGSAVGHGSGDGFGAASAAGDEAGGAYGSVGVAVEAAEAEATTRRAWDHLAVAPVGAEDDADEVARQLAMLSPRAAQAVAAAAAADSDSERDAHLEALEDGEEPVNRGLLLKFLSSVKS
jgi:hypothetical protein